MKDVQLVRERQNVIATFSKKQLNDLLNKPDLKTFTGVRNYTAMLLLIETGIRANELVGITLNDVKWEDSTVLIKNSKGYKQRLVPIQATMKKQLSKNIALRGIVEETDALFITVDNTPLSKRQLQNFISDYGKEVRIKDVRCSPHTFRHTFAKMSVQNGAGIFELQQILGHTSMEMVRNYVNLFSKDVKKQHRTFSPLQNLNRDNRRQ